MAYVETYKGVRLFQNETGECYCIDHIMRKSLPYPSIRVLKSDIDIGDVMYKLPVPMDNSDSYIRTHYQDQSHIANEVPTKETEEFNERANQQHLCET